MARKMNLAVVGLGSVVQRGVLPHLDMADAREAINLVAVCDTVKERAEELAKKYKVPHAYTSYEQVLADKDVEAITLATPIPFHFKQAMDALKAGKHVHLNKTMTITKAEADQVIAAAKAAGKTVVSSPGQMFSPAIQRIKALLAQGVIGQVYWGFNPTMWEGHTTEGWRGDESDKVTGVDPTWYYKPGGGPVMDVTVYALHNLTSVLGPVKKVSAFANIAVPERVWKDKKIKVETEDNVLISLDFGGHTLGLTSGQLCQGGSTVWGQLCFFGAKGAIEVVGGDEATGWPLKLMVNGQVKEDPLSEGFKPVHDQALRYLAGPHKSVEEAHVYLDVRHLAECAVEGVKPVASAEHARHVIEVIELAYKSSKDGKAHETTTAF
jgi:predicted dehydrogenase